MELKPDEVAFFLNLGDEEASRRLEIRFVGDRLSEFLLDGKPATMSEVIEYLESL